MHGRELTTERDAANLRSDDQHTAHARSIEHLASQSGDILRQHTQLQRRAPGNAHAWFRCRLQREANHLLGLQQLEPLQPKHLD